LAMQRGKGFGQKDLEGIMPTLIDMYKPLADTQVAIAQYDVAGVTPGRAANAIRGGKKGWQWEDEAENIPEWDWRGRQQQEAGRDPNYEPIFPGGKPESSQMTPWLRDIMDKFKKAGDAAEELGDKLRRAGDR
jgi:hypothetical protein